MKHLVKNGNRIKGFVFMQSDQWYYAFGRPSQDSYISFACDSLEQGIARIEVPTFNH